MEFIKLITINFKNMHYPNEQVIYTFTAAGCIIEKDGKYLLVQEAQKHVYGLWNLPAGKVEDGYTIAETAVKEAKEETGFDVEIVEEIPVFHKDPKKPVRHAFIAKITGGELKIPEGELLDAKFFSYEEIMSMKDKHRSPWIEYAINFARNNK